MRLEHCLEDDMNFFGLEGVDPGHLRRLPPERAGAIHFAGFRRHSDIRGSLVSLDELERKIRCRGKELGIVGSAGARSDRAELDARLALRQSSAVLIPLRSVVMHTNASAVGIPTQPNLRSSNCTAGFPIMCCKISGPDQWPMTVPSRGALL